MENLKSLTVAELKERLKENGMPVTGTKQTLMERLMGIVFAPSASVSADGDGHVVTDNWADAEDPDSDACEGAVGNAAPPATRPSRHDPDCNGRAAKGASSTTRHIPQPDV